MSALAVNGFSKVEVNGNNNGIEDDDPAHPASHAFWRRHSTDLSVKSMMLDSNAEELTKQDAPEIISYLPNIKGKSVVELGAGIGRFTTLLAEKAGHVVASDFMESYIEKNKESHTHFHNIDYIVSDATKIDLPACETDLVFSNWLLMYLEDEQIRGLLERALSWLKIDGFFFCRESCFRPSGNIKAAENPTNYRTPAHYDALFRSVTTKDPVTGKLYGFDLVLSKSVEAYIQHKQNHGQIIWLLEKVPRDACFAHGYHTFQEFLDNQQYSKNGILRYEKVFGRHFVSTGGRETTEEFLEMLNLKPGERVLDVGCGIGGSMFLMAEKYGAHCIGLDLSFNMITIGLERAAEVTGGQQVRFEVADATKRDYDSESFDVVYSRDTILHIEDKLSLFKQFYKFLRPGGRLLISDYCCGDRDHTPAFKEYVRSRGYFLLSPEKYGEVIEEAGFVNVRAMDKTGSFQHILKRELSKCQSFRDEFIEEFGEKDFLYVIDGWKSKLVRCAAGDQKWGLFYAEKPQ